MAALPGNKIWANTIALTTAASPLVSVWFDTTGYTSLLLSAVSADAQYFGRNKVQYDRFQFAILETTHFDVYYYPEERSAAEVAAQMAERSRLRARR